MQNFTHLTQTQLEAGLDHIRQSPKNNGVLHMIVRRPDILEREVLENGKLDEKEGLVGDNWLTRGSRHTPDGSAELPKQLNIMNARAAELVAQSKDRWPLAGDQLYVDLDLSESNLQAGTQLSIGETLIEVTSSPHNGCKKFVARFGLEAMKFVNSPVGKELHLRGICARVITGGDIRVGDTVKKV